MTKMWPPKWLMVAIMLLSLVFGLTFASQSNLAAQLLITQVLQTQQQTHVLLVEDPLLSITLPLKLFSIGALYVLCPAALAWLFSPRFPSFTPVAVGLFLLCVAGSGLSLLVYREYMQGQINTFIGGNAVPLLRGQLMSVSRVPLILLALTGPGIVSLAGLFFALRRARVKS